MRRMSTVGEWSYWNSLARDRPAEPFELAVLGSFPVLLGAGFSSMFHTETVTAVRTWLSLIHISEPTRPSHISRMPSSA